MKSACRPHVVPQFGNLRFGTLVGGVAGALHASIYSCVFLAFCEDEDLPET